MTFHTNRISLAFVAVAAAAASSAAAVDAAACTPGRNADGHFYGEIYRFNATSANNGAAVNIYTNALTSGNTSNLVNHEMWYGVVGNGAYWVEVGVHDGVGTGGVHHDAIFWADNRAGSGGYHEHYPNVSWHLDAWYQAEIAWAGRSCAWNVYFGGVYLGVSTSNCAGPTRALEAGLEASNDSSIQRVGGYLNGWEERNASNVWTAGWPGFGFYSNCPAAIQETNSVTTEEELHGPF